MGQQKKVRKKAGIQARRSWFPIYKNCGCLDAGASFEAALLTVELPLPSRASRKYIANTNMLVNNLPHKLIFVV